MRGWALAVGGLAVWAAHFFTAYITVSLFPGEAAARWVMVVATLAALAANGEILRRALRTSSDEFEQWVGRLGALGAGVSMVAVAWQSVAAGLG